MESPRKPQIQVSVCAFVEDFLISITDRPSAVSFWYVILSSTGSVVRWLSQYIPVVSSKMFVQLAHIFSQAVTYGYAC